MKTENKMPILVDETMYERTTVQDKEYPKFTPDENHPNVFSVDSAATETILDYIVATKSDLNQLRKFQTHDCIHNHKFQPKYEFCKGAFSLSIKAICPNGAVGEEPCCVVDISDYENL